MNTVLKLLAELGAACADLHDAKVRDVDAEGTVLVIEGTKSKHARRGLPIESPILKQRLIDEQKHDYLLQGHTHIQDDRRVGRMRLIVSPCFSLSWTRRRRSANSA